MKRSRRWSKGPRFTIPRNFVVGLVSSATASFVFAYVFYNAFLRKSFETELPHATYILMLFAGFFVAFYGVIMIATEAFDGILSKKDAVQPNRSSFFTKKQYSNNFCSLYYYKKENQIIVTNMPNQQSDNKKILTIKKSTLYRIEDIYKLLADDFKQSTTYEMLLRAAYSYCAEVEEKFVDSNGNRVNAPIELSKRDNDDRKVRVDVNSADQIELEKLPYITQAMALRVVEYRNNGHHPFETTDAFFRFLDLKEYQINALRLKVCAKLPNQTKTVEQNKDRRVDF